MRSKTYCTPRKRTLHSGNGFAEHSFIFHRRMKELLPICLPKLLYYGCARQANLYKIARRADTFSYLPYLPYVFVSLS